MHDDIATLPRPDAATPGRVSGDRLSPVDRLVLETSTMLRLADTPLLAAELCGRRPQLDEFLDRLEALLRRCGDAVDETHFTHLLPQRALPVSAR